MTDHREVVAAKRDGATLSDDALRGFILAHARGSVSDELAAAFLMACYIRGLNADETVAFTRAIVESGGTLSLDGIARPTVDKHSTGGVTVSATLVFAPLAASVGLAVGKLSGRGLGHTGGTLDKLEAIPGLRVDLTADELRDQVERIGCAVAAQTPDLVPADGGLYALRDATATVGSIPLIAASVMSKKLAVETDLILLDVKAGSGAFMKTPEAARELAEACAGIARAWERRIAIAVTDMSQPLGEAIGNALDVAEAVAVLRDERDGRLRELAVELVAQAQVRLLGIAEPDARARAERGLSSGEAAEAFGRMVEAQGGDPGVVERPEEVLPRAPVVVPLPPARDGVVARIDAEALGRAAVALGAGRRKKGDPVDPAVGIVVRAKVGDRVGADAPVGEVHARREEDAERAATAVREAIEIGDAPVDPPPLVYGWHGS